MTIRYPRGRGTIKDWKKPFEKLGIGTSRKIQSGKKIAVLSIGNMLDNVLKATKNFPENSIEIIDMRFIKPLDEERLHQVFQQFSKIITIEDGCIAGGFNEAVISFANQHQYTAKLIPLGIPDQFIEQGSTAELQELAGISVKKIQQVLAEEI